MGSGAYEGYLSDFERISNCLELKRLECKTVFITGARGLIGSCLADAVLYFSRTRGLNTKVVLGGRRLDDLAERFSYWEKEYIQFEYEARDDDLPGVSLDYVFHCASNAHPSAYAKQPVETSMANALGTFNLLSKLANDGKGRMVYVSSSEVYGRRKSASPYREDDCYPVDNLDPRSCYPISKRLAENLCASFSDEYGVDFVIVRPGHVFGPTQAAHDDRAHAQFAREAAAGDPVVMKSIGTQFRSYCYVVDCVSAILFAALSGQKGEAYNIANPDSDCTIAELARAFAVAGEVELIRENATSEELRGYNRMENSALDSSKLRSLGWSGCFSLDQGVARTIGLIKAGFLEGRS